MHKRLIGGIATALLPLVSHSIAGTGSYGYTRQAAAKQQRLSTHYTPWQPKQEPISRSYLESANIKVTSQSLELQSGQTARELVIIDSAIPDKHVIYQNNAPGVDVVEIDSSKDGLSQLKKILSQYHQLDAMHLFSHATDGVIQLGNSAIDADLLKKEVNTLASIDNAMKEGADVYFYGCNLAQTEQGEELLELVSNQANVDVAASSDATGHEDLGGDWDLEISKGDINTQVRYDSIAMNAFEMVLPFSGNIPLNNTTPIYDETSFTYTIPTTTYDLRITTNNSSIYSYYAFTNGIYLSYNSPSSNIATVELVDSSLTFDLTSVELRPYGDTSMTVTTDKGGVSTETLIRPAGGGVSGSVMSFSGSQFEGIKSFTIERADGLNFDQLIMRDLVVANVGSGPAAPAPGGVNTNLQLWLKGNDGAIADSNGFVSEWTNQSSVVMTTQASRVPSADIALSEGSFNFNDVVTFSTAGNKYLRGTFDAAPAAGPAISFGVINGRASDSCCTGVFTYFNGLNGNLNLHGATTSSISADAAGGNTSSPGFTAHLTPSLIAVDYNSNSTADASVRLNGVDSNGVTTNAATGVSASTATFNVGTRQFSTGPTGRVFVGDIAEIISYADNNALTKAEILKIESYLAIKYGITLGVATLAYTDSSGNGVFFYDGLYDNDVFAIGQDDGSALDQRVSKSVNSGALVTVSLDNDFTSANDDPVNRTTSHANDGEFIFFSNNGDSGNQITEMEAAYDSRTSREWKVSVATSFTSDFHMQFDGYDDQWVLLKSADDDFSDNDQTVVGRLDVNGIIAISNADLGNGARFILASSADTTPPPTPSCSTTPSPANTGTAVTMLCTGIETAALVSTPGMSCGAEDNGSVTCTGTIGTAGLLVSNDTVTVTDASNNSNTSATTGLIIDDTPPAGPGTLTGPGSTNDINEDIVGSCGSDAANGTVKVTSTAANGFTTQYDVAIPLDANGDFTIVNPNWSEGQYSLNFACSDGSGNGPTDLGPFPGVIIDVTAPATPTCSTVPSPANDGTAVTMTCTGVETGATLTTPGMTCGAESGGSVTCTGTVSVAGLVTSNDTVTITDTLGNANTSANTGLIIDNSPPAGPGTLSGPGSTNNIDEDLVGSCGTDSANGTVKVTTTPVNGFSVMYDTVINLDAIGGFTIVNPNWSEGSYSVTLACTDEATNGVTSLGPFPGVIIDVTVPSTPSCSTIPSPANNGTAVIMTCTGVEQNTILTTIGMSCSPTPTDATEVVTCTGTVGTSGLNVSDATVVVTDSTGNQNTTETTGLIIDNTAPTGIGGVLNSPTPNTSDINEDIIGSCGPDAANGTVKVTTTPANGFSVMYDTLINLDANGAFAIVDPNWTEGSYTVNYACTDEAGNGPSSVGPFGPITIDPTPPAAPVCTTTPSPAAAGEDVVTTCTGVEVGSTLTIPNMVCSPTPADASGEVTCTGTVGTGTGQITTSMAQVTVTDTLGNVNSDANTGLEIQAKPLIVGTDGIGGGSLNVAGLLLLLIGLFTRSVHAMRKKVVIGATLALMSVCLTSPVFAQEGDFYVGLGVGPTSFNPLENGSSTIVTDDSDIGHQWLAGYDFTNRIAIEAFYGEYGAAQTDVPGSLDYHEVFGAGLVLTLTNANKTEGLSSYVSIGIANLDVDSGSVPFIQDNGGQIYGGIGLRYTVNDGFSGRLEYKDISGDAHMFSINITKRFRLFK